MNHNSGGFGGAGSEKCKTLLPLPPIPVSAETETVGPPKYCAGLKNGIFLSSRNRWVSHFAEGASPLENCLVASGMYAENTELVGVRSRNRRHQGGKRESSWKL